MTTKTKTTPKTSTKTKTTPKTSTKTKTTPKTKGITTPETKVKTETAPITTAKTTTQAQAESALTLGEILWDLAPDSLNWEEKTDWMDHWWSRWDFHQTSENAGRLTGPTQLYPEAVRRLQKAGYRARLQSGMGRSWLYISR